MQVGIYSEFYSGNVLGGREFTVAVLAEFLSQRGHVVHFVHHDATLTAQRFTEQFGIRSDAVVLRYVSTRPGALAAAFVRRRRERKLWERSISEPYAVFVNLVHGPPVRCYAPCGVLLVLFPFFEPFRPLSGRAVPRYGRYLPWILGRYIRYRVGWKARLDGYRVKTSNSAYTQRWTQHRWGVDTLVLYPPTDASSEPAEKANLIVSVGRFAAGSRTAVSKRQLEMMSLFADLGHGSAMSNWNYASIGACGRDPADEEYFRRVQKAAEATAGRGEALGNASRQELAAAYGAAKIFWHAAGLADDEAGSPQLSEHFGIATVDAMAAGCVPIVINKGAQSEIVEHGISGFLWSSLDELRDYTLQLIADQVLWQKMSQAAQQRARFFSRAAFEERFLAAVPSL